MITFETLVDQAKERGMPTTKMRGILREYLQILILKEIYNIESGRKLFFTGGTYLRLINNLKRFSEDLDFNAQDMSKEEFEELVNIVSSKLSKIGLSTKVKFNHWQNLFVAKVIFDEVEGFYGIKSKYSKKTGIVIKIEVNNPSWKIIKESEIITGFGQFYPCICTDKGILFADKIDALIKKNRARHIYDIIFMLANHYSVNEELLRVYSIKVAPFDAIINRMEEFSDEELKKYAESLRPFLFDENEADFIINAKQFVKALIDKYKK